MKKIILILWTSILLIGLSFPTYSYAIGSGGDIASEGFTFAVNDFFPWMSTKAEQSSNSGIKNISSLIISLIPMLTTMMAVGAVLMVIWGGFSMVIGGASTDQTEKGKGIMKDAIMGLVLGLLAYVIITLLGSILNI